MFYFVDFTFTLKMYKKKNFHSSGHSYLLCKINHFTDLTLLVNNFLILNILSKILIM